MNNPTDPNSDPTAILHHLSNTFNWNLALKLIWYDLCVWLTYIGKELVDSPESRIFDSFIGAESHPDVAFRGGDHRRVVGSAVAGQHRGVAVRSIADLQIVVIAVLVRFYVKMVAEIHADDLPVFRLWPQYTIITLNNTIIND